MAKGSIKMCMQCATCSLVSTCLFRALKYLSQADSRVRAEAKNWPKGKSLKLEIPGARGFTVTGTDQGFQKLPQDAEGDVTIRFKSPADAFRVFTGQISVAQATPATPMENTVTKITSMMILAVEENARKRNGVLESPRPEKMPVAML